MRSVVSVAILVSTSFLLAGCAGGDDEHLHFTCPNGTEIHQDEHPSANTTADLAKFCAKTGGTGSKTNTTSQAPNALPVLVLNITDSGGNASSVVLLDGNLTFSAVGSSDSDGSISGIAVTVTDSNTTRTATLYDAAKQTFKDATFTFDRPGVINVTVAMVDDRAGFTLNQTHVYVNEVIMPPAAGISLSRPPQGFANCGGGGDIGPQSGDLYEAQFYKQFTFNLVAGATKVVASSAGNVANLYICSPENLELSPEGDPTETPPGTPLPAPLGTNSYYVAAYIAAPDANVSVAVTINVHYEPQAAPAA